DADGLGVAQADATPAERPIDDRSTRSPLFTRWPGTRSSRSNRMLAAVLPAAAKILQDRLVQSGLVRVPAQAPLVVDGDVPVRVEIVRGENPVPREILPVRQLPVPEIEDVPRHEPDPALDDPVAPFGPAKVVWVLSRVAGHPSVTVAHRLELTDGCLQEHVIASADDHGLVESRVLEILTAHRPRVA